MKKITLLLALMLTVTTTFAQTWNIGYPNGNDNITATLSNGTLTISGDGFMQDFVYLDEIPWFNNMITDLVIENGVLTIGRNAFSNCFGLRNLTIPESVMTISDNAFSNSSLTSVTIPESVGMIGNNAFGNCFNLTSITNLSPVPLTLNSNVFMGVNNKCVLKVPSGSLTAYQETDVWKNFNIVEFDWYIGYSNGNNDVIATFKDGTLTISGRGAMQDFYDPPWEDIKDSITTLVIEEGVTTIGAYAFSYCSNLKGSLTIPNSVTSIGRRAFFRCSGLSGSLNIPGGVTVIDESAFWACEGLNGTLIIPANVTTIGSSAFGACHGLSGSLTIPAGVTTIGDDAFDGCSGLFAINVEEGNANYSSENGILYNKNKTTLIECPAGKKGEISIPEGVTTIGDNAFYACSGLTGALVIPEGVTTIGYTTFSSCNNFISLTIPASVTTIKSGAFANWSKLVSITNLNPIPLVVDSDIFYRGVDKNTCKLNVPLGSLSAYQNADVWKDFKNITEGLYYKIEATANNEKYGKVSKETWYKLDDYASVTAIPAEGYKFVNWTKDGVVVSSENPYVFSVTEDMEFTANFQTGKSSPDSIWYIGSPNTMAITATLINGTLTISGAGEMKYFGLYSTPWYDVRNDSMTLVMEEGIATIGNFAFNDCSGLSGSLTIPASVKTIGIGAFEGCTGLSGSLTIPANVKTIGYDAFEGCSGLNGSLIIPEGVTAIGSNAFDSCSGLSGSLIIPGSVKVIGYSAFLGCRGLNSLIISEGVTTIETGAFFKCAGLSSLIIPSSMTAIGGLAFYGCTNLTSVSNYAVKPQKISIDEFGGLTLSNITLHVPAASLALYQNADVWKDFNIVAIPEVSGVSVTPSDNSAVVAWERVENATGYKIIIYSDEAHTDVVRILEFDANGRLINTVPLRSTSTDFSHTIENLSSETPYFYMLQALGTDNAALALNFGEFETTDGFTTGVIETVDQVSLPNIIGYYSVLGVKLPKEPQHGVYIIMYDNGKAVKKIRNVK